jgi:MFS family permease
LWTPQFSLLIVSAVFMYISTFMLTPTLPLFVARVGAGDLAVGGIIVAAYTFGSLLPRIFWGNLADRWLRQGVYLIGVALIAVLSPLFAVTVLLPVIIGLRFLQGVGFSGSSTAGAAMSADLIPASRRAEGVGYYTLANTIGMAFGPALGLGVLQTFGPGWLFGASVISGAFAFSLGLFLRYERVRTHAESAVDDEMPGSADPTAAEPSSTITISPDVLSARKANRFIEPTVLPTSVVFLFVILPYGAIMAFIAAYGLEQGVTQIGLYFTVFAIALFVVRLGIGRISDKHGVTVTFVPAIIAMAAGLVVLWWAASLPVFLLSAALFGLGFGVALPVLQATAYTFAPAERRGAASATFFATADIAYGVGAMLLGLAMSLFDHRMAFAGLAIYTLLALVAFFVVLRPRLIALGRS